MIFHLNHEDILNRLLLDLFYKPELSELYSLHHHAGTSRCILGKDGPLRLSANVYVESDDARCI
jgi:hypothetical protein